MYVYWLNMIGTIAFAVSGVLLAGKHKMDPFGALVLGLVTAIGGGTIRDMALDNGPVFWVTDQTDLIAAIAACVVTMLIGRRLCRLPLRLLPFLDAIGLAVFVAVGINRALLFDAPPLVAVVMGVLTGVGGGMLRDMLAGEVPMVLRTEIYATACIVGGAFHAIAITSFALDSTLAMYLGMAITLTIRLAAIRWHLKLPSLLLCPPDKAP